MALSSQATQASKNVKAGSVHVALWRAQLWSTASFLEVWMATLETGKVQDGLMLGQEASSQIAECPITEGLLGKSKVESRLKPHR